MATPTPEAKRRGAVGDGCLPRLVVLGDVSCYGPTGVLTSAPRCHGEVVEREGGLELFLIKANRSVLI